MISMDALNPVKNKEDLKQFFNDEYVEHVDKIRHTIELQINADLKHYMAQNHALINQVDSMRQMIEQIQANTIKEEIVIDTNDLATPIIMVGQLMSKCSTLLEAIAEKIGAEIPDGDDQ